MPVVRLDTLLRGKCSDSDYDYLTEMLQNYSINEKKDYYMNLFAGHSDDDTWNRDLLNQVYDETFGEKGGIISSEPNTDTSLGEAMHYEGNYGANGIYYDERETEAAIDCVGMCSNCINSFLIEIKDFSKYFFGYC